jgi:hypothetical protein
MRQFAVAREDSLKMLGRHDRLLDLTGMAAIVLSHCQ